MDIVLYLLYSCIKCITINVIKVVSICPKKELSAGYYLIHRKVYTITIYLSFITFMLWSLYAFLHYEMLMFLVQLVHTLIAICE